MKFTSVFAIVLACAAISPPAFAIPEYVKGGKPDVQVDDLTCRINSFDQKQVDDFLAATKVTVYSTADVLDPDEFEKMCSAIDESGAVTRLRAAIKENSAAAKWFEDNGLDPDRIVLMVQNADQTVDLYIH
ncbi:hypothetical protein [Devosia sp. FJ2-5-3]|uniref:hypothetical protein n=1 Tax=Devosia sp. FJ2-5-3 TaxID=2976680 RepID=UPI0023D7EFBF|nr:hypothetical protein [Devosia sp. FJ2-5-3]WEJ56874.1 hypothetical protein N0P34_11655 [Devosia sp. FJ2-5-3]